VKIVLEKGSMLVRMLIYLSDGIVSRSGFWLKPQSSVQLARENCVFMVDLLLDLQKLCSLRENREKSGSLCLH
jgi:hypothetical protein